MNIGKHGFICGRQTCSCPDLVISISTDNMHRAKVEAACLHFVLDDPEEKNRYARQNKVDN